MLVLSRKRNESIVIGPNIKIQVLKISGSSVRLGITAPRDVKVIRGELAPYEIDVDDEPNKMEQPSRSIKGNPIQGQAEREQAEREQADCDQDGGLRLVAEFDLPLGDSDETELRIANPFVAVMQ